MENDLKIAWNLQDGVDLVWRRLGGDYLVFNEASGETHLPHPLSEWVLREIENSPVTLGSLADRLVRETKMGPDMAISRLREVLAEVEDLGLVMPDHTFA